ncbi:MAG: ComEC/Rec2 family competence protein [Treponema sp.]|nr:ComEC/Rec2 family competence protein [Treponema sp.]
MLKTKFRFFSSIEIAAFLCVLLIYTKIVPVYIRQPFLCVFKNDEISQITGIVCSNPNKTSKGNVYIFNVKTNKAISKNGDFCDSSGIISVMAPTNLIEAHYPGKLYHDFGSVIENGVKIQLKNLRNFKSSEKKKNETPLFYCEKIETNGWKNAFAKIRAVFRIQFKRLMFQWRGAGGLLLALLSGSREYTDTNLANAFRNAGLSHILALSGMHLSFFSGIATKTGKGIFGKKYVGIFSLFAIFTFVWFAGLSPSLFRALICSILLLFFNTINLKVSMFTILSCSFIIQAIIFPQDVNAIAFILSYGALLGIILFSKPFQKIINPFCPKKIANSLAASVGAQFITMPVSLSVFGSFASIGIIATVIVSPLISLFLLLGFALVIISLLIPPLLEPLGVIINIVYNIINYMVCFFAQAPSISI